MNKEQLLALWLDTDPNARSPYKLYGCPPMWETLEHDGMVLFTRPCRTMAQVKPFSYKEGHEEKEQERPPVEMRP